MSDTPTSYPLSWPFGWPRTRQADRRAAKFWAVATRTYAGGSSTYRQSRSVTLTEAIT